MAFRMSSCLGLFSIGGRVPFLLEAVHNKWLERRACCAEETVAFAAYNDRLTSEGLLEGVVGVDTASDLYAEVS